MSQTKAQLIGDLTQALEFITTASTPADGLYLKATNQIALATNSVDRITAGTSELVINESGASVDFRVEGDTNANLLFVDASADRVGLGTNSPQALFECNDSANDIQARFGTLAATRNPIIRLQGRNAADTTNCFADIQLDSENQVLLLRDPGTSGAGIGTNPVAINNSGNVGIGTTSPSTELHLKTSGATGPTIRLEGTAPLAADNLLGGIDFFNIDGSGFGPQVGAFVRANVSGASGDGGYLAFGTNDAATGGEGADATEKVRIDSSGRLLIGTTSSTGSTAGDDLQIAGSSDRGLTITSGSTSSANIFLGDDGDPDRGRIAYQNNDDALDFSTNGGGTDVRIDSNGRLLVGRTSQLQSSSERFTVDGGISVMRFSSASNGTLHVRNEDSTASTNQPYIILTDGSGNRGGIGVVNDSSAMWLSGQAGIRFRGGSSAPGNTEFGRFDTDGLKFNGDTAAANALDDYEEGSWTPLPLGLSNTPSWSNQKGRYTKIGRLVHLKGFLQTASSVQFTTTSDVFAIGTLPFAPDNNNVGYQYAAGSMYSQSFRWLGSGNNTSNLTGGQVVPVIEEVSSTWAVVFMVFENNNVRGRVQNNAEHNSEFILEFEITYTTGT